MIGYWVIVAAVSHINYWDQVNSWKISWNSGIVHFCRNKLGPSPLLNVAQYWKSSNTEACAKKLSQILANNIDIGVGGLVSEFMLGIVQKNEWKIKSGLEKPSIFFSLNSLFLMFSICQMVLWLIGLLLDHFDPLKNWSVEIMGKYNEFLSLKVNILSIQSVLFSRHAVMHAKVSWTFFMEYTIKVVSKVNKTDQFI